MVFRNANGTQTGKDNNGNNIFLNLSGPTPTSSFTGVTAIHKAAGTFTYAWSTTSTSPAIAVGTSGQYIVTVTDGSGCSRSDTSNVFITNNLSVNIGRDTAICPSGSVHFDAGAGFVSYHWSTGDSTRAITVSAAGVYSVSVSGGNGCTAVDSARVTVSGAKVNAGTDVTRCTTAPVTLTASGGFASYQWFGTGASSITHVAVHDGCYWLRATDSAGCTSYDTVSVNTSGVRGLNNHDTVIGCTGDTSHFDASVNVNAAGDSIVVTFNAAGTPLAGAAKVYMHSGPEFHPFQGWQTAYTVGHYGVDDGLGQMSSAGVNKWRIAFIPSCYYGFNPDTPLNGLFMVLRNADGTLSARGPAGADIFIALSATVPTSTATSVTVTRSASSAITYAWSNGSSMSVGSFTTPGTYFVTATEGFCSKVDTVVVNIAAHPTVHLGNDTCLGTGGSVVLNAGSGYTSYVWSTGASTQTITAHQAGTYWVRVTNTNGCVGIDSILVSTGISVSLGRDTCVPQGGSIVLNAGVGFASYLWNTSAATSTITVTAAGIYAVTVTNTAGCHGHDSVTVTTCSGTTTGGCAKAHFRVLSISNGTVTFRDSSRSATHYTWSFGDSTTNSTAGSIVHTYTHSGTYTVRLTVCNDSCVACDSMSLQVTVTVLGIAEISGLSDINLYPNPASNVCTIDVNAVEGMDLNVSVIDIIGSVLQSEKWQIHSGANKLNIDLTGVASGMYEITLTSGAGTMTRKLNIIK